MVMEMRFNANVRLLFVFNHKVVMHNIVIDDRFLMST